MIYRRSDGTTFVLAHHTNLEWADVILARLIALGCSEPYATQAARRYLEVEE